MLPTIDLLCVNQPDGRWLSAHLVDGRWLALHDAAALEREYARAGVSTRDVQRLYATVTDEEYERAKALGFRWPEPPPEEPRVDADGTLLFADTSELRPDGKVISRGFDDTVPGGRRCDAQRWLDAQQQK